MSESSGRVADATGNWVDGLAPPFSRPYLRLARLDRPIGSWLLLMPCWWSLGLAGMHEEHIPSVWHIVLFFIGAFAMRGAGCTWNDLVDRDLDGLGRTHTVAANSFEAGHGRAGDFVHAGTGPGRADGADPVQSLHDYDGARLAHRGRDLSFHETDHLLAADFPRARFLVGRADGLAGCVRSSRLARARALCRIDLLGNRLRYHLCAPGSRGRPYDRNQIDRAVVRRAYAVDAGRLLRLRGRADRRRPD